MEDTIAAVSTPPGSGAIGIIRISGSGALQAAMKLFRSEALRRKAPQPRHMYRGAIIDPEDGRPIDQALFVFMKAPLSATGEDVAELHCHGSAFLLEKILDIICADGVRMAEPGEFTRRAFLNGRVDLTQAEAVVDIINARSDEALKSAIKLLDGSLAGEITALKTDLLEIVSDVEASIDFPEDDIDIPSYDHILTDIKEINNRIELLAGTFEQTSLFKTGVQAAIIGKPNVGKSSLLNRLLGRKRAIVTAIAGTTRDTVEEQTVIGSIPVRFIDTAGICKSDNEIEKLGVDMTLSKIDAADMLIFMLDGSRSLDADDLKFLNSIKDKQVVVVINKNDLPCRIPEEEVTAPFPGIPVLSISALKNNGVDMLKEKISNILYDRQNHNAVSPAFVSTLRQKTALENTAMSLNRVVDGVEKRVSAEFIATDLRAALSWLGEITGDVTTEEILDSIFNKFCIGK